MNISVFKSNKVLFIGLFVWINFTTAQNTFVPCQEMPAIMSNYNADYSVLVRFYTPSSGGGYWGRVTNTGGSPELRGRLVQLYTDYMSKLEQLNFNELPQECKVDFILFKRDLEANIESAKSQEELYKKIQKWFPFSNYVYSYEKKRRRGIQLDAEVVANEWNKSILMIDSLKTVLKEHAGIEEKQINHAITVAEDIQRAAKDIFQFYNGYDPMFTWWVPKVYTDLDSSLTSYVSALKTKIAKGEPVDESGIVGVPVGRDELVKQLKYEMIPYSPEELIEIANKEFKWCDEELLKATKEMGFGTDWQAAQEKVKNSYVEPGKQPEMIYRLYAESVDFLKENDLISVPPLAEEVWGMRMMSPERQLVNPFFTGGSSITISYPTNTMTYDQRMMSMRGNNPHFSRSTVHHELIAGHNLQGFVNSRNRTYRNFRTPFWTEGWALYWELLLWDMDFPQGPEDKIGMLFWHMHRCARIIFSLNYHLGKWTPQECIDFLVDRVGFEKANAEGEVRRSFVGSYPPLYQLAYLTGGRQFYALRKEMVESGKMTNKEYHDKVMQLNAMPVEMIRAILTDQKLKKNFKTTWKFYN